MKLNNNVKYLMIKKNITRKELAKELGINSRSLDNIFQLNRRFTLDHLILLQEIFNVTCDDLLNKDLTK